MMPKIQQRYKHTLLVILTGLVLILSGCSTGYYDRGYQAGALPKVPEISRPTVARPRYTPPQKPYSPEVGKYSVNGTVSPVITQTDVAAVTQETLRKQAKQSAVVNIDPYASIPDNSSTIMLKGASATKPVTTLSESSPAVKSLMVRARADIAIGQTELAVSKLERGLRIESQNPDLWHLLAKAHYAQANHQQAISMAKKSIRYSSNDDLIAQNWELIKKSGEKSGDTTVVKEAINYFKVNP